MRKILAVLALCLAFTLPALADNFRTLPGTSTATVWDTTTGSLYGIGINGHGLPMTVIPNAATTNTWTAPNTFTNTLTTTGAFAPSGKVATQGMPFTTVQSGNPLLLATVQQIPIASINAAGGYSFLSSATGRTIYPTTLTLTPIGGNAAAATSVVVECTSGNILGTFPIAALISAKPVTPFSSTGTISSGLGFTGCAASDGVFISTIGSALTTSTSIVVNATYTVQ